MRLTRTLKIDDAHEDAVWCCAWAPTNKKTNNDGSSELVTGSVDETVKVWSISAGGGAASATERGGGEEATEDHPSTSATTVEPLRSLPGHTLGAVSVAVDASGTFAASSSLDSFVRVWRLDDSSATKAVIETPPGETWQIAFPPPANSAGENGSSSPQLIAAAGGASNKIVVWSADSAEEVAELPVPDRTTGGEDPTPAPAPASSSSSSASSKDRFVLSVAYSPDGKIIACGAMDGGVHLFDVGAGKFLRSLPGHHRPVRSVAFSADSAKVLTACDDMHSHVYDASSGALVAALGGHASWVTSVAPHPGGIYAATASSDSTVKLWDLRNSSPSGGGGGSGAGPLQTAREHADQVWGVSWSDDGSKLASVSDDKSVCVYAAG